MIPHVSAPPLTGPEAIYHALKNLDIDKLEEEQNEVIRRKLKSKRPAAVKILNAIAGMRKNNMRPDQFMIKSVPVIPPVFRPFSVVGDAFVPGDANELYKDLFEMRDSYAEERKELGVRGSGNSRLALYDSVKALYGTGDPVKAKTKQRGVSGFLRKVTGTNPKYCYDADTEILTENGWVLFSQLQRRVRVATINPSTLNFEWQMPSAYVDDFHEGIMYRWKSKRFDMLVTPEHRMWCRKRRQAGGKEVLDVNNIDKGWDIIRAEDLSDNGNRRWYQTAATGWDGEVWLPDAAADWCPEDFASWLGWWLAEGDIHTDGTIVTVWQTSANKGYCNELESLIKRLPGGGLIPHRKDGVLVGHGYRLKSCRGLCDWLKSNCGEGAFNKRIPAQVKNWPSHMLNILLESYMKGDGSKRFTRGFSPRGVTHKFRDNRTDSHGGFSTTSKQLFDDLAELCVKLGLTVTIRKDHPYIREAREDLEGKPRGSYKRPYVCGVVGRWNCVSESKAEKVSYSGRVYCVSTDNGLLVIRRNGKTCVSGNSFIQRKLLSKPQDNVSRGTIAVDPDLTLDEIGVPWEQAWSIYAPYIQRRLVRSGLSPKDAIIAIRDRTDHAKKSLEQEVKTRPVIYSRAPSWHKFNVVAGRPKLIDGDTIAISPLVTTGLNADFDGDAMHLHVPAADSSVKEAWDKLLPSKQLFSIREQDRVVPQPKQELILGMYSATHRPAKKKWSFPDEASALKAIKTGTVAMSDEVEFPGMENMGKAASCQEIKEDIEPLYVDEYNVEDMEWLLDEDKSWEKEPEKVASADLSTPVILGYGKEGQLTVLDGLHKIARAKSEGFKTILARL